MNSVLLTYKKLAKEFRDWRLVMNLYDLYIQNSYINKQQLTILFHINNLMLIYLSSIMVTEYIKLLDKVYRTKDLLVIIREKVYEYLRIIIDFSLKVGVGFSQYNFIKKLYNKLLKELKGSYRNTPIPKDLFKIDNKVLDLCFSKKEQYYKVIAKSLFLSQRQRLDIKLPTEYHYTRVKRPNIKDWKKLRYILGYLWLT